MALALQTAPTVEPLTVDELKRQFGVDFGEHDDLILRAGTAGRQWVEAFLGRAIIHRTYDLYFKCWPGCRYWRLPYPPLSSVTSIAYTGTDGSAFGSTVSSSDYTVETWREPGRVVFDYDFAYPTLYGDGVKDEIRVRFVAGASSTAAGLLTGQRQNWLQAIALVGRDFYEEPTWHLMEQNYENPAATALLWSDRFLGEVDGL